MADNVVITAGLGTPIAADLITGGVADAAYVQRLKMGYGADGAYTDADTLKPMPGYTPGGLVHIPATQFARPANTTAYAAGDLVADNVTAGSVVGMVFPLAVRNAGEAIRIERLRLRKSTVTLTNASFRVYMCRALPTLAVGDNGVFNTAGVLALDDILHVLGWFDIVMDRAGTAGARGVGIPSLGPALTISPVSGTSLIGLIEATLAYAPGNAETFNATLEGQWS